MTQPASQLTRTTTAFAPFCTLSGSAIEALAFLPLAFLARFCSRPLTRSWMSARTTPLPPHTDSFGTTLPLPCAEIRSPKRPSVTDSPAMVTEPPSSALSTESPVAEAGWDSAAQASALSSPSQSRP